MSVYQFSQVPVNVPRVHTEFRCISTSLPVPESLPILNDLAQYESRSMHGQLPVVWDRAEGYQVFDAYLVQNNACVLYEGGKCQELRV